MTIEVGSVVVHPKHGSAKVVKKFVNEAGEVLYQIDPSGLGYKGMYMLEVFAPANELFVEEK